VAALVGSRPRVPPPFGLAATGKFAFDSNGEIFVAAPDGTGIRPLLGGSAETLERGATWSRDGTRVAYLSGTTQGSPGLWVANADGSAARKVSGDIALVADRGPAATWSPDGRLAFATGGKLYVATADGSAPPRPLGDDSIQRYDPAWSPTGTLIAFRGGKSPVDPDATVHVITTDGQRQSKVSSPGAGWHDWSPDGTRLVYAVGKEPVGDILMATFDGMTWTEKTLVGPPGDDVMPRWSNDGTRVAFLTCLGPGRACLLAVVAAEGGAGPQVIADEDKNLGFAQPCWSPDDRFIAALTSGSPGVDQQGIQDLMVVLISVEEGGSGVRFPAPRMSGVDACSWQRLAP
jgi:Tol biopolymer transport system component